MENVTKSVVMALVAVVILPAAASAQERRFTLSFTPAVVATSGDSELALAGSATYRFAEHFAFEGDVTWIDAAAGGVRDRNFGFDPRITTTTAVRTVMQNVGAMFGRNSPGLPGINERFGDVIRILPALGPIEASTDGQTWIGTMGVRYEPPVETARFRPYLSGGIGINFTDQTFSLAAVSLPDIYDGSVSHSGVAFSAGGGANVHLGGALWANADAKYFHLSRDRDLMRVGGGVSFRF